MACQIAWLSGAPHSREVAQPAAAAVAGPGTSMTLDEDRRRRRFEAAIVPHLDTAYNLARWLTRSAEQAEDVVQTACLRALRSFDGFAGANPRGWLLAIVRNTFYSWLDQHRTRPQADPFDEELHSADQTGPDPEAELLRHADAALLREAIAALPVAFREVIVLRELEGLSYKEIAAIGEVPIGTVMSRLARARRHLQDYLIAHGVGGSRP